MPSSNDLYSGDVHAAAERALEWAIRRHYGVQTEVYTRSRMVQKATSHRHLLRKFCRGRTVRVTLAAKAFELFQELDTRLTAAVQLGYNYEELPLQIPYTVDDLVLCQHAMVGVPVLGGSEEGRSFSTGKLLGV